MTVQQLQNLVVFCILMEHDGGVVGKDPRYILEKFRRCFPSEWDEAPMLHPTLRPLLEQWMRKFGKMAEALARFEGDSPDDGWVEVDCSGMNVEAVRATFDALPGAGPGSFKEENGRCFVRAGFPAFAGIRQGYVKELKKGT